MERVLFRIGRSKAEAAYGVTAVFPDQAENNGNVGCYAHIGQHGACSRRWYYTTRPAKPDEYADLKSELESASYHYEFRVMKRWAR